jgi:ubiquinone/menaquinone biosynthesis C-methylase UbiE
MTATPIEHQDWVTRLEHTQAAFDSVAADYDGPRGNNASIQDMREEMWHWLDAAFVRPGRLLDLGCGTGLDAVRMAQRGHRVTAADWSPQMVDRTRERAASAGLSARIDALHVGAHELERIDEPASFEGAYSNLGPLNCVPDLTPVSRECARLLKPRGRLVFTVIGRICPWEMLHYAKQGRWERVAVRFARGAAPVGMNQRTIWTRYYTPGSLYRAFAGHFTLEHHRGICVFAPPPYLTWVRDRHPDAYRRLWRLDRRLGGWPLLRAMGDHFLIVMRKR